VNIDDLRRAFEEIAPAGSIITNWMLVAEVTDGMSTDLHIASTEGMTPWMAYGMLAAATQMVSVMGDDDADDD
jgi:hypothetical protein